MSEENTWQLGKVGTGVLTFVLWVITSIVAFWELLVIRGMALRVYARFGPDYRGGVALQNVLMFILVILCVALVIGGGEYHYKHVGKPKSWELFGRTITVQLSILVLALFI